MWGGGGSAGIIFATMLHVAAPVSPLNLIFKKYHVLKKFNFTFDPSP